MAVAGDATLDDEAHDAASGPLLLHRRDAVTTHEVLVQLGRPPETGLDGVGRLVDVVPVEREPGLEPQGVARPEPDRDDAGRRAGGHEPRPDLGSAIVVDEDLEPVLAGVAGARDDRARIRDACPDDAERRQGFDRLLADLEVGDARQDRRRSGTLDRDEGHLAGPVVESDAGRQVGLDVREILGDVRGVHDHEVLVIGEAVDDHVIDDRSTLVREEPVARLAHGEARDVARDEPVDRRAGAGPDEEELAHVREIEQPRVLSHGTMLGDDAGRILDRHLVARELHHLSAGADVLVVQRRALQGVVVPGRVAHTGPAGRALASRARSRTSR